MIFTGLALPPGSYRFRHNRLHKWVILYTRRLGLHGSLEKTSQDASYPRRVLEDAGHDNAGAGGKHQCFAPLQLVGVPARKQGSECTGSNKQGHVFAPGCGLDENTPTAEDAAGADAETAIDALPALYVLADDVGTNAGPRQTDTIVEEGDVDA